MSLTLQHSALILCDYCANGRAIDLKPPAAPTAEAALKYFTGKAEGWLVVDVDGKKLHACPRCAARKQAVA